MKRFMILLLVLLSMGTLCGCSEVMQQIETAAGQIDAKTIVTDTIENIDWDQLEQDAKKGYDALTDRFPALKSENIKSYLKNNGLNLLNSYVQSSDAENQENARKLGEILKILNPELTDEVDAVITK